MVLKRFVLFLFVLSVAAAHVYAAAKDVLTPTAKVSVDKVKVGSSFQVAIVAKLDEDWHVQSNDAKKPYIPTELKVTAPEGFNVGGPVYSKSKKVKLASLGNEALDLFEETFVSGVTIKTVSSVKPGKYTVNADLRYQACNSTMCRPPKTTKISIPVEVVAANAKTKATNKDVFTKPPFGKKIASLSQRSPLFATIMPSPIFAVGIIETISHKAEEIGDFVRGELSKGNLSFPLLLLLWTGGILSAFSPCVIPIIPMTVAFFGNQAQQRTDVTVESAGVASVGPESYRLVTRLEGRAKALSLAVFYVAGITVLYSAIGVFAVMAGKSLSFLLQGPALWLMITVLFGAMGLSMFGLFEIPVPAFVASKASARKGFPGAFVMGLVASVLFLPCAGPVVGAVATGLIALGKTATTVTIFKTSIIAFCTYTLGLGTPFLVLALLSGEALKAAPRGGEWTVALKRIMGMVFLGLALHFSNFVPHVVIMATFLVGCGIYLAFFEKKLGIRPVGKTLRWATAIAIVFAGFTVGINRSESTPVPGEKIRGKDGGKVAIVDAKEIVWLPYEDKLFEEATKEGKPIVIDFTAEW